MTLTSKATLVAVLPNSDTSWTMLKHNGRIFLFNKDHPPHVYEDGEVKPIEWLRTKQSGQTILAE
jgi:hypothetical protein